jgi:hypothetical protein
MNQAGGWLSRMRKRPEIRADVFVLAAAVLLGCRAGEPMKALPTSPSRFLDGAAAVSLPVKVNRAAGTKQSRPA